MFILRSKRRSSSTIWICWYNSENLTIKYIPPAVWVLASLNWRIRISNRRLWSISNQIAKVKEATRCIAIIATPCYNFAVKNTKNLHLCQQLFSFPVYKPKNNRCTNTNMTDVKMRGRIIKHNYNLRNLLLRICIG